MSLLLGEAIADATLAYVRDYQAAKLADVASRNWSIALELPVFKTLQFVEPDRSTVPDLPALFLVPDTSEESNPGKGGASGIWTHRFEFVVVASHPGLGTDSLSRPGAGKIPPGEASKRASLRYVLALFELLKDMRGASSAYYAAGERVLWGTGPARPEIIHGLTYTLQSGAQMADARLLIGVEHSEARS